MLWSIPRYRGSQLSARALERSEGRQAGAVVGTTLGMDNSKCIIWDLEGVCHPFKPGCPYDPVVAAQQADLWVSRPSM
jgi:hypothetical protein